MFTFKIEGVFEYGPVFSDHYSKLVIMTKGQFESLKNWAPTLSPAAYVQVQGKDSLWPGPLFAADWKWGLSHLISKSESDSLEVQNSFWDGIIFWWVLRIILHF